MENTMKIEDLKDKQTDVNIDVKVIYDKMEEKEFKGKRSKTLVVANVDSQPGDPTALLDVFDDDIDKYKFQDKMRLTNAYAKIITTKRGEQPLITYGFDGNKLIGSYEHITEEK